MDFLCDFGSDKKSREIMLEGILKKIISEKTENGAGLSGKEFGKYWKSRKKKVENKKDGGEKEKKEDREAIAEAKESVGKALKMVKRIRVENELAEA